MSEWIKRRFYDLVRVTGCPTASVLWSLRVRGQANVPRKGPVLVLSNHESFFDPLLIGLSTTRRLTFLARETLFKHPVFSKIISLLDAFPIDQQGLGRNGLRQTLDTLQTGRAVLVFPEGERTWDGAFQPLKAGVSLLLSRFDCPILPVGIAGAFEAWPRTQAAPKVSPILTTPRPGSISLSFGPVVRSSEIAKLSRPQQLEKIGELIKTEIARAEEIRRKPRSRNRS